MSSTENARKRLSRVLSDLAALDRGSVLDYLLVAIPRAHGRPDAPCQLHVLSSSALEAHRHLLFPTVQSDLLLSTLRSTHPASAAGDNCTSTSARGVLDLLRDDCSSLRWGDDLLADASALTIQLSTTPDDAIPHSLMTLTSTPSHHHSPAIVRSPNQLGMHGGAGGGGPPSATQLSTPASCSSAVYATLSGNSEIDDEFLSQAQRARPAPIYVRSTAEIPEPICARDSDQPEYYPLAISDSAAVTEFLEAKFRELQQLVCKIVAKAWIKVIEPKKQTNHPYNKGEGYKPDWWPSQARHKEPDHLMKPERLLLLISMLRSRKADLRQLRSATLEYSLNIPKNKMEVLEEIYYVADMEERYQRNPSRSDEALIIWTIAPEKPTKSVQAAAAAAVKASSRSMTTIASQMPKSVSPLSPAKRALEEDAYIKAEEPPSQKFCRENSPIQQQQQQQQQPSSLPQSQPQPQQQSQTSHQPPQQSHQQEHQQPLPQHAEQQPQEPPKPQYISVQVPQHPQERAQFVAVNLNQAANELPQVSPHQQHSGLLEQHQSQHLPYNSLLVGGGGSRHPSASLTSATPATAEALTGYIPRDSAGGIDNAHQLLYMPRSVMTSASTTPPAFFNANSRRYTTGSIEDSLGQLVQHQQHQQHLAPPSMVPTPEHGTPVYDFVSPPFQQHQQQLQHQQALGQMAAHSGTRKVRQRSMQDTLPRSTIYPALGAGAGAYQGFPDMTGQVPWDKSAHEQPQGHQSAQQEMIINHHDSSLMDADLGSTYAPAFGDEGDLELGQWRECTDNAV